jgi:hypothetical protein
LLIFGKVADTIHLQHLPKTFAIKTANAAEGKVYPDRFLAVIAFI